MLGRELVKIGLSGEERGNGVLPAPLGFNYSVLPRKINHCGVLRISKVARVLCH